MAPRVELIFADSHFRRSETGACTNLENSLLNVFEAGLGHHFFVLRGHAHDFAEFLAALNQVVAPLANPSCLLLTIIIGENANGKFFNFEPPTGVRLSYACLNRRESMLA